MNFLIKNVFLFLFFPVIFSGCISTIAPKPVVSHSISYSGTNDNSGLIYTIKNEDGSVKYGIITKELLDKYNILIKKYGSKFFPKLKKDAGIIPNNDNTFKIDGEHLSDLISMIRWSREDNKIR